MRLRESGVWLRLRVGLLLDKGIEPDLRLRHQQVSRDHHHPHASASASPSPSRPTLNQAADACRATLGVNVGACVTTDVPLDVDLRISPAGASWGTLGRPDALLAAANRLVDAGCTAIAVRH